MTPLAEPGMDILFVGKRFYTNKDAWKEKFGRMFRFPAEWAACRDVALWLIDYHTRERIEERVDRLRVRSTPIFSFAALTQLVRAVRSRPRVVVASGDPYIGLLGYFIASAVGAVFAFDIYDKFDEFRSYRRWLGFDLFSFLRRKAQLRIYASRSLADVYERDACGGRHIVAPNGVDEAVFRSLPRDECRRSLKIEPSDAVVGYFGSMEPDRGVSDLIEAVALLRKSGRPFKLMLCGRTSSDVSLDFDWIDFRGMVPHAEMPLYLNAPDVLVLPYRQSPIMDMGASCKIAEYLMCERPMVSTRNLNFTGNFPQQAVALGERLCEPRDPEDLARSILGQLDDPLIVPRPEGFSWHEIAASVLASIEAVRPEHSVSAS